MKKSNYLFMEKYENVSSERRSAMAGRKTKKKTLNGKQRLKLIFLVLFFFVAGVMAFLQATGIYTIDTFKTDIGSADKPAEHPQTEVYFIDVGQGDSTLVVSKGEAMLIDSGERDRSDKLINYLKKLGIKKFKYIINTHPHSDHMGEMADVLKNFSTEKFIMPKVPDDMTPTSYVYENMLKEIKRQGIKITKSSDMEFALGSCKVSLYTPKEKHSDLNNYSTLVKVTDGDNSFLITGDCEEEEEKDILSQGFDVSAKVLKVGHHGSSTSSSAGFLNKVLPRYAVISCGKDNKYGHPHETTVRELKKYVSKLYITMDNGTVIFSSDGKGLTVKTQKGDES